MKKTVRKKKKIAWGQIFLNLYFVIFCMCYILPMLLMVGISLNGEDFLKFSFIPEKISLYAYEIVFKNPKQIFDAYGVTLFYSIAGVVLSLVIMSMFAYALSRSNFKLKGLLTFMLFFTMIFGGGMVPTYMVVSGMLHLDDTIWVYILPGALSAWNVIVIKTFFRNLPQDLFEAARLDGASELRICFNVAVPLSTPILATIGYSKFLEGWNDWLTSSIYIKEPTLFSLQYLLKRFMDGTSGTELLSQGGGIMSNADLVANIEPVRYAMAIVGIGPALLIFPFIQKYYDKGIIVGSIKG